MKTFAIFLRAVNVGGTGKLPMSELRELCTGLGFADVKTYIASGNLVLSSEHSKAQTKALIEQTLQARAGKPVGVVIRTPAEMRAIRDGNPFADKDPKRTVAILLDNNPAKDVLTGISNQANEDIRIGKAELYVHYPDGIGESRLRIPAAKTGTARNINTIHKMVGLSQG